MKLRSRLRRPPRCRTAASLLLLSLAALPGCAVDLLSPNEPAPVEIVSDGLVMQLSIDRSEIRPDEEFTARYSIRNTLSEPVRLKSLCTPLARGVVYRNAEEVAFMGSSSGCRTAIGTHEIAAGETAEWQWRVRAAIILQAYPDGREPEIVAAEAGQYVFRVEPDVFERDGVALQLPPLEQQIVIR